MEDFRTEPGRAVVLGRDTRYRRGAPRGSEAAPHPPATTPPRRRPPASRRRHRQPVPLRVSHALDRPGPGAGDCTHPGMKSASASSAVSPYDEIPREEWARLSQQTPLPLSEEDVTKLRGLGDRVDLHEVDAVYRPISRLLNIHVAAAQSLRHSRRDFLAQRQHRTPYVIAVAGSVADRKSVV